MMMMMLVMIVISDEGALARGLGAPQVMVKPCRNRLTSRTVSMSKLRLIPSCGLGPHSRAPTPHPAGAAMHWAMRSHAHACAHGLSWRAVPEPHRHGELARVPDDAMAW